MKLDMSMFDAGLLLDEHELEIAICVLEGHVHPSADVKQLVDELCSIQHLFEYMFSVISNDAATMMAASIIKQFLTKDNDGTSVAAELLSILSLSLLFMPYKSDSDPPDGLNNYRAYVQRSTAVLKVLTAASFPESYFEDSYDGTPARKLGQKKKKSAKRAQSTAIVDARPFDELGLDVPTNKQQSEELAELIRNEQKAILECYLNILRDPKFAPAFKDAYITSSASASTAVELSPRPLSQDSTETVVHEIPAAFPMVQPMKAALYFDSADGFGEWRILISTRADRDLRQTRKRGTKLFGIIVKKIKELSNGHFSDDNQKRLTGTETDVPIYEAKMTGDSRLVYQVDCVPEFESDVERQVLRIFGIYTHAQLDKRFWNCVGLQLGGRGPEYKHRCVFRNRPRSSGDNVYYPASFPPTPTPAEPHASNVMIPDLRNSDLEEALLNSILADQDVTFPFDVSPQEKEIIEHTTSCYVLGRSGTGKTTTMLFKILGIERSWEAHRDVLPKPRQLFVTQSRVLAEKVEEFFIKMYDSLASASRSSLEVAAMSTRKRQQQDQGLVDREEEVYRRGDLPQRYGDLEDEHFPLFITFDHLCKLLEAELSNSTVACLQSLGPGMVQGGPEIGNLTTDYMQQSRAAFVSYRTFLDSYWCHFPQYLVKGLDPALVYSEFMGVIKGSEQALSCEYGYLDRESYMTLSHRTQGTFASHRDTIYTLFEVYLKRKKTRREYDAPDRTHVILKYLKENGVPGKEVDFIYVDETQDNLLIDALVLRTLCKNPDGLFWAGDTAQTISIGSSFRFDDLKAFLFRNESQYRSSLSHSLPRSFQLAVNYRSHAGIVNCAHAVIELIMKFWPHSIDLLARERGLIDGSKPVYLVGWDQDSVRYEQFLFGDAGGKKIEFGAKQCILVRDDAAKHILRERVGDIGLMMTLYESKGLEFDDVLLYNFFEDSLVGIAQWRLILNALPGQRAPVFDDIRHGGVCRELKFLYVAITRARKNLWIADGSEKGEPMRLFWTARDQVQTCEPGSNVPHLATSSTPAEWAEQAKALFDHHNYLQAMHSYDRAFLPREKAVAYAYYLREQARATAVYRGDAKAQSNAFVTAADAFVAAAQEALKEQKVYFRIAAECFVQGGDNPKAANAFFHAEEFTSSAWHYREAGMFDDAVRVVQGYHHLISRSVANTIIDVSKLYYLRGQKIRQARQLYETDEDMLEYMEDFGLNVTRAEFLEELGRFTDAAETHLEEGRTFEAIRLFLLDPTDVQAIRRGYQCLLKGWRKILSLGVEPNKSDGSLQILLRLSSNITPLEDDIYDEIMMFCAIAQDDRDSLETLAAKFHKRNPSATLMCLDRVFATTPKLDRASVHQVSSLLYVFSHYARLLHEIALDCDPCHNIHIQKLLGLEPLMEDRFLVIKGTPLYDRCREHIASSCQEVESGWSIGSWDLGNTLNRFLRDRLRLRISAIMESCREARPFRPCLPFVALGRCSREATCWREHLNTEHLDAELYNCRVRMHFQLMLIYNLIGPVEAPREVEKQQTIWLLRLYEALWPPHYRLGAPHILKSALIPELERGAEVLKEWTRNSLYQLKSTFFGSQDQIRPDFLASLYKLATLRWFLDSRDADNDLSRIPCVSWHRPPPLLRPKDQFYVVHNMLECIENMSPQSLSHGMLFVNHIVGQRIPVDITALCDFMDYLCGALVVSKRTETTLHDTTLPRSWLLHQLQIYDRLAQGRELQLLYLGVYTEHMGQLLEEVYTESHAEHIFLNGKSLAVLPYFYRNIFITRICRNLCLLGYNINDARLRNAIIRAITSLKKPGRFFIATVEGYVNAKSWKDLARTVRHSVSNANVDEMVQLYDARLKHFGALPDTLPGTRRVVYQAVSDIPALLMNEVPGASQPAEHGGALAPTSLQMAGTVLTQLEGETAGWVNADQTDLHEEDQLVTQDEEDEDTDNDPPSGLDDISISVDTIHQVEVTDAEVAAAHVFQRGYRARPQKKSTHMTPLEAARRRNFAACLNASQTMEWPHDCREIQERPQACYRKLFLGPLPHLLVCLEGINGYVYNAKKQLIKRTITVQHRDLETVIEMQNKLSQLFKKTLRLQNELRVGSDAHVRRDTEQLKRNASQVRELMEQLPNAVALKWWDDLEIALKGIVQEKRVPVKQVKPELNVEDDLLEYY